jgi:hypothetical protein
MRRFSKSAVAFGIATLLVSAAAVYALASTGAKSISVCVKHTGGVLYRAKRCAKHDQKLTWNKRGPQGATGPTGHTGPQGPGATYLVYDASGAASPTPTPIGAIGPWTITGTCQASAGTTTIVIDQTGPAAHEDSFLVVSGMGAFASSQTVGPFANSPFTQFESTSTTPKTTSGQTFYTPTRGPAIEVMTTASVAGGATNTCHFTAVVTPVRVSAPNAAAQTSTAAKIASAKGSSIRVNGVTIH